MITNSNYSVTTNRITTADKILDAIRQNDHTTVKSLSCVLGYSTPTTRKEVLRLEAMNAIRIDTTPVSGKRGRPEWHLSVV